MIKPGIGNRSHTDEQGKTADRLAQLTVIDRDGKNRRVRYATRESMEAPNWTADGTGLIYNNSGSLFRISVAGTSLPRYLPTGDLNNLNNDHCLSPDGGTIYMSADDGHLYSVGIDGGQPRRISNDRDPQRRFHSYLHGVSADGHTLVYVGLETAPTGNTLTNIYTIPAQGGADRQLTDVNVPVDGPEFSPDGKWIYFNGELAATRSGHAQLFRMAPDGTGMEQLTDDARVNWFPHPSPDGEVIAYLSYPPATIGHPADREVMLKLMKPDGSQSQTLCAFRGGQGTINVNSWSPDSRHLAFVAYPKVDQKSVN